jgi:hypothetical protein
MKPSNEVLVKVAVVAALAIASLCGTASAASPVVKLTGDAALHRGAETSARFHVNAAFSTDTPGADLFTIQKATIFFPDHAGTNGRLFPSCSARQIKRFHGNVNRCPKGSRIGSGTLKAKALQIGLTAGGTVAMFNSHHGRSITFNIQTILPAYINKSLDAPITQLHGKYGEKLTLVVPPSLQEILSGVFVGLQEFDVTIDAGVRVRGVDYTFLKARTCPKRKLHGVFDFVDGATGQTATTTTDTKVACELR